MAAKIFEVGDVLPATTQLRISWENHLLDPSDSSHWIELNQKLFLSFTEDRPFFDLAIKDVQNDKLLYTDKGSDYDNSIKFFIIDTSLWTEINRTITYVSNPYFFKNFTYQELDTYSITYEENGGSTVTDLTEQTNLPNPLPIPTKANHVFAGWYYDNLFTQKANAGDELTTNVTLYAKWYTPTTWCEDIADAIREKEGSSDLIKHVDFPDRIRAL